MWLFYGYANKANEKKCTCKGENIWNSYINVGIYYKHWNYNNANSLDLDVSVDVISAYHSSVDEIFAHFQTQYYHFNILAVL